METCKSCRSFIPNGNPLTGSCLLFSDPELINQNSTVYDPTDNGLISFSEVGENFGCIHHEEDI